jgi:nitrate reductase NapAB chaperone NapD
VKPYQPDGVWEAVAMIESNTHDYRRDSGENLYRRSMYTFWKRSAPPASLDVFNAPNREVCVVRRERTNTPLQALVTLNDPQFVEAARHLAQRALLDGGPSDDQRMNFIAGQLLARTFKPEELPIVKQSLAELKAYYEAHAEDAQQLIRVGESKANESLAPATLAAWTLLVNELLNLDEVLNK